MAQQNQIIESFESSYLKKDAPKVRIGDNVRVYFKIVEGKKERTQVFAGTVVALKGSGLSETVTVYRNAYGSSMEKVFLLHSPMVDKIETVSAAKVRRAKLNYIRGATGKAAKLKQKQYSKESTLSK